MKEGLLYPTLHRMVKSGLLVSEWEQTESKRRRKFYKITAEGRNMLKEGSAEWATFMRQMQAMLES